MTPDERGPDIPVRADADEAGNTAPTPPKPKRTPEEQEILEIVARGKGWDWVNRHEHLILEQARAMGDL
jgi:hypothetical protein